MMVAASAFLSPASCPRLRQLPAAHILFYCINNRNPKSGMRSFNSPSPCASVTLHPFSPLMRRPIHHQHSLNPSSHSFTWRLFCNQTLSADAEVGEKVGIEAGEGVRKFKKRLRIVDVRGGPDEGLDRVGQSITIRGWVRTCRVQSIVTFIEVNDGSCLSNIQCVVNSSSEGYNEVETGSVGIGASVLIEGTLVRSEGSKQKVELKVARLAVIGKSDPSAYPIQKKRASREFLRTIAHFRPRTNTFGAVTRVRNALAYATHKFFQENGFVWISTPIITASDCEGAGEQFCVTTLIPSKLEGDSSPVDKVPATKNGTVDWSQVKYVLENCKEDMDFFDTWIEKGIVNRLRDIVEKDFIQLTYTDAVELLLKAERKFEFPVKWGTDLQSEHERYITENAFDGRPVIIRDYPKDIKAFYMRLNDDEKTVAAMDVLVPRVGELIGGSQREERLEYLERRLEELNLPKESYWWYLDIRRFGSVPHAGFGLGFERLVQFATGMENIRDVIPFPRTPGSAEF